MAGRPRRAHRSRRGITTESLLLLPSLLQVQCILRGRRRAAAPRRPTCMGARGPRRGTPLPPHAAASRHQLPPAPPPALPLHAAAAGSRRSLCEVLVIGIWERHVGRLLRSGREPRGQAADQNKGTRGKENRHCAASPPCNSTA